MSAGGHDASGGICVWISYVDIIRDMEGTVKWGIVRELKDYLS